MSQDCNCDICKGACEHKPGWFLPGEAEQVANHLGISLQELFSTKLGVDWWVAEGDIFVLAPATLEMEAGTEYPAEPRGQCVFYENGLCSIHPVKPYECRTYFHDENKDTVNKRHKAVAEAWQNKQEQIIQLLGREPESEEFSIFNMLSLW